MTITPDWLGAMHYVIRVIKYAAMPTRGFEGTLLLTLGQMESETVNRDHMPFWVRWHTANLRWQVGDIGLLLTISLPVFIQAILLCNTAARP